MSLTHARQLRLADLIFGGAAVLAFGLYLWLGSGLMFSLDEWEIIQVGDDWSVSYSLDGGTFISIALVEIIGGEFDSSDAGRANRPLKALLVLFGAAMMCYFAHSHAHSHAHAAAGAESTHVH